MSLQTKSYNRKRTGKRFFLACPFVTGTKAAPLVPATKGRAIHSTPQRRFRLPASPLLAVYGALQGTCSYPSRMVQAVFTKRLQRA